MVLLLVHVPAATNFAGAVRARRRLIKQSFKGRETLGSAGAVGIAGDQNKNGRAIPSIILFCLVEKEHLRLPRKRIGQR